MVKYDGIAKHYPVMLPEVLAALSRKTVRFMLMDILALGTPAPFRSADCTVYAIDRDPSAVARATILKR